MATITSLVILFNTLIAMTTSQREPSDTTSVYIGALLSSHSAIARLTDMVNNASVGDDRPLKLKADILGSNPIDMAQSVCDDFIHSRIHLLIISHPNGDLDTPPTSISYTCGFYKIPVIAASTRDAIFSDKSIHPTFLRTVPPWSEQVAVVLDVITYFEFFNIVVILPKNEEGRVTHSYLMDNNDVTKNVKYQLYEYNIYISNITQTLSEIKRQSVRVIYLSGNGVQIDGVLSAAQDLGMISASYVWLISEPGLFMELPDGVIVPRLVDGLDEDLHVEDAFTVAKTGLEKMFNQSSSQPSPPSNCSVDITAWEWGPMLYQSLTEQVVPAGKTGPVSFLPNGDRLGSTYDLINVQDGKLEVIGSWSLDTRFKQTKDIIWPGNIKVKPEGLTFKKHLRVVTAPYEEPFVFINELNRSGECPTLTERPKAQNIKCWDNATGEAKCCSGYCMDLLFWLSKEFQFTYDIDIVKDRKYGGKVGNKSDEWNGMVGDLLRGRADMIISTLTIDNDRAQFIDFTNPFKHQGLSIVVKKKEDLSNMTSFIEPFEGPLWVLILVSVHVVALILYLLDRFSPFGHVNVKSPPPTEETGVQLPKTGEEGLNLASAFWFAWGVLLNSGIGESSPRSFSGRVFGMVWAGFAMIIVASYTANLAAFLVLERPDEDITGINDVKLRNPSLASFKYGTVKDSAVENYFKKKVDMSNMYRYMQDNGFMFNTTKDAIAALLSPQNTIQAFIWDSAVLDYYISQNCRLIKVGEPFHRSGYAIGLTKDNPWTKRMSAAILNFQKTGRLEGLDRRWIVNTESDNGSRDCTREVNQITTLGLKSMAGVFIVVGLGIVTGVFVVFIEIFYKRHKEIQLRQAALAKAAARRWRSKAKKTVVDFRHRATTVRNNGGTRTNTGIADFDTEMVEDFSEGAALKDKRWPPASRQAEVESYS